MTKVFLRPRPLATSEAGDTLIQYSYDAAVATLSVVGADSKSYGNFAGVLAPTNSEAFAVALEPIVRAIAAGDTACCFAYGHTNSGKTHTVFGYGDEPGLYELAVRQLFERHGGDWVMQIRFFELYNGQVFDLLNNRQPGFVREDADGSIHVRSATTMGPQGEVLTQSLAAEYTQSAEGVLQIISAARRLRAEGTSELHQQSSRSHAVLELEMVTQALAIARTEIAVAQSKLVPIGKARDDATIAMQYKMYKRGDDGKYTGSGYEPSAEELGHIEDLNRQVSLAEAAVANAKTRAVEEKKAFVGGMLVLVDLAGAEYTGTGLSRSAKEQKEAREINTSLLALKECIRARSDGRDHVPYRNSKLTMLLKAYLESSSNGCDTVMIATVSAAAGQLKKATNTIQYAALVASADKS